MSRKEQNQRLIECIQVRQQLSKLGALLPDAGSAREFRVNMNEFLKAGTGFTLTIRLDDRTRVKVVMTDHASRQSGVILEKM
jgi:hypothetical protein